jgi:hypothetical protein
MKPATVYRLFDADDRLLYVGRSISFLTRLSNHETKPWWRASVRVTLEHFDSVEEAASGEARAIASESPVHNIARPKGTRSRRPREHYSMSPVDCRNCGKSTRPSLPRGVPFRPDAMEPCTHCGCAGTFVPDWKPSASVEEVA